MTSRCLSLLAAISLLGTASLPSAADGVLVLTNARVYTVDANRSWAEAIAVDENYLDFPKGFVGDRANAVLPLRSITETGALVTLSSDWDADETRRWSSWKRCSREPTKQHPILQQPSR